jgi:hypothetical protein
MTTADIFERLWIQYSNENPSAGKIYDLFQKKGNRVINDHVAFRTYDDPRIAIDVLARPFLEAGYVQKGEYRFEKKKLRAKHFEHPGEPEAPRVFMSELMLNEFSEPLQHRVKEELDRLPESYFNSPDLIYKGTLFTPLSYEIYKALRSESEYAAWFYVFGFRANHFTVSINHLDSFDRIEEVNAFLKSEGFPMNRSGGEVKGSPEVLLEQSSTLADKIDVHFEEGIHTIPSCFYEFALRYPDETGELFSGFIAESADKIFESTDYRS